ncbi:MerR family transcriptional regulator [Stakelama marina]|uniref:MerR family transcriptional regulator n=1 Tax=Stakelama marina TaxID=2826939 RepID=A0A8T4IKA1_9SPHN|nr:MerR family transcriptional regulator [Stakelama marina]MBR0552779.1 MerR family transcriptional regulator [Stakelama marina]
MTAMTIGKAAKKAGVSVETIRFYERRGLIEQPAKPDRSVRRYSDQVVREIRFIKEAQQLGFTLRQAGELLDLRSDPTADRSAVRLQAIAKRREVRHKIFHLQQIDKALSTLVEQCPGCGDLHDCSIIESLESARSDTLSFPEDFEPEQPAVRIVTLLIAGLRCPDCADLAANMIAEQPDVRSANVSYSQGQARLTVTNAWTGPAALNRTLAQHGYAVEPPIDKTGE